MTSPAKVLATPDQPPKAHSEQSLAALTSAGDGPPTPEQAQIVQRLVERIDYDGVLGKLTLVMRQDEPEAATELSA